MMTESRIDGLLCSESWRWHDGVGLDKKKVNNAIMLLSKIKTTASAFQLVPNQNLRKIYSNVRLHLKEVLDAD